MLTIFWSGTCSLRIIAAASELPGHNYWTAGSWGWTSLWISWLECWYRACIKLNFTGLGSFLANTFYQYRLSHTNSEWLTTDITDWKGKNSSVRWEEEIWFRKNSTVLGTNKGKHNSILKTVTVYIIRSGLIGLIRG